MSDDYAKKLNSQTLSRISSWTPVDNRATVLSSVHDILTCSKFAITRKI